MTTLEQAIHDHREGRLEDAAARYRLLLAAEPEHADALHLLGQIRFQAGDHDAAFPLLCRACLLHPERPLYAVSFGQALARAGHTQDAIRVLKRARELAPSHAPAASALGRAFASAGQWEQARLAMESALLLGAAGGGDWNLYAITLAELGRDDESLRAVERAIDLDPSYAEAYNTRANVLVRLGRRAEAEACYQRALALTPGYDEARENLLRMLAAEGRWPEVAALAERTAAQQPEHAPVWFNLGLARTALNHLAAARAAYERAISIRAGYPEAHNNLGHVLLALGEKDRALDHYRAALELRPDYREARYNLGVALQEMERPEEAREVYSSLVAAHDDYADAWNNLGGIEMGRGKPRAAIPHFERALACDPGHPEARWNLGLAQLATGDFANGWRNYEARRRQQRFPHHPSPAPEWDGQDLSGRHLLVWAEQGLGDTLQFLRHLELIRELAGRVSFACQPRLRRLLDCLPGIEVHSREDEVPADFQIPLLSLPLRLGITAGNIPPPARLVIPDADRARWREKLSGLTGRKIGICWAGSAQNWKGRRRSSPLAAWESFAAISGISLVSLQRGPQIEELHRVAWRPLVFEFEDGATDLIDTAAVVAELDLVITVDTLMAHLAATMGKPTWILLNHAADWRWMTGREDSPWYPAARLLRQANEGDWESLLSRTAVRLATLNDLQ